MNVAITAIGSVILQVAVNSLGSLSVAAKHIQFEAVTLNGQPQVSNGTTASPWDVKDPTGTGAGYHVNIKATDFSDGAGHIIAVSGFRTLLPEASIVLVQGNEKPLSGMTTATALSGTDQVLLSAALNKGMGTYTANPTFTLDVPAETYAGAYESVVTVQIVAGP